MDMFLYSSSEGIDVEAQDVKGNTAMDYAQNRRDLERFDLLFALLFKDVARHIVRELMVLLSLLWVLWVLIPIFCMKRWNLTNH
jgi:hypothetical protein